MRKNGEKAVAKRGVLKEQKEQDYGSPGTRKLSSLGNVVHTMSRPNYSATEVTIPLKVATALTSL